MQSLEATTQTCSDIKNSPPKIWQSIVLAPLTNRLPLPNFVIIRCTNGKHRTMEIFPVASPSMRRAIQVGKSCQNLTHMYFFNNSLEISRQALRDCSGSGCVLYSPEPSALYSFAGQVTPLYSFASSSLTSCTNLLAARAFGTTVASSLSRCLLRRTLNRFYSNGRQREWTVDLSSAHPKIFTLESREELDKR